MAQFTKQAIMETFLRLLEEKSLDKITVKDIVDACGVNRNTFYYYFQDIYALLNSVLEWQAEQVLQNQVTLDTWPEAMLRAAEFSFAHRKAVYHIYQSSGRERLLQYLLEILGDILERFLVRMDGGEKLTPEDMKFLVTYHKYAMAGMILQWLQDEMKEDPEEMMGRLAKLMEGSFLLEVQNGSVPMK